MASGVRVGGVWNDITKIHARVAGTWQQVQKGYVRVAGVWEPFYTAVSITVANITNAFNSGGFGTIYAGIRIAADGNVYEATSGGAFTSNQGAWLSAGAASDVWVQVSVTSGSLNWVNAGSGRLQCNVNRDYGVNRSTSGTQSATVSFNFYDAASGGNLLATKSLVSISAERL